MKSNHGLAKRIQRQRLALFASAAALALAPAAWATPTAPPLVDVNFYDTSTTTNAAYQTASGAAVVGISTDIWNNIGIAGEGGSYTSSTTFTGSTALENIAGNSSGLTLSYSGYISAYSITHPSSAIAPGLMTQYLAEKPGTAGTTLSISGLDTNSVYDIYVYAASFDSGSTNRATTVSANGTSAYASGIGTGSAATSFVQGDNYVLLTPMSNSSGVINITQALQSGSGEGDLNGLQIQSAVNTFTQDTHNSNGTNVNFWSTGGNWNTGSPAGSISVATILASGSGTYYNADLNGASETVIGLNLGAGSNIYNSGATAETLTIAPGSSGYNSTIAGNIGSTTGTLPGGSGGLGGSGGGAINLVLDGGANTISGQLFGALNLTVAGGTTTLSNANNTYTGATDITSGTLALSGAGSIADSSGVNLSTGATFDISQISAASTTINGLTGTGGTVSLGSKALVVDVASGTTDTFGGVIQDGGIGGGTGGSLTLGGAGTLSLAGANTYTGATDITSGTLALSGSGSISDSSVNLSTGGTFDISQSTNALTTINGLTGTGGTVALGSKTLVVDVASGATDTFGGVIEDGGNGGSLVLDGQGTLALTGTNNTYSGGTTLDAGTLAVGSSGALGSGSVNFNGGTLETTASTTFDGIFTISSNGGTFNTDGVGSTIHGSFVSTSSSGLDTLTIIGGGTLSNDAFGISSNIQFEITGNSKFYIETPSSNNIIFSGNNTSGQLLFGLNGHTDELGNVSIADTSATTADLIDGGGAVTAINGAISNSDPYATLTLQDGQYNIYGNNTSFNAGTLVITNTHAELFNTSGGLGSGATLELNGGTIQNAAGASMTFNNAFLMGTGGGTVDANGQSVTLGNTISGAGSLTVESSAAGGVVTIAGANTYTGGTLVESGATLAISADDNLGAASADLDMFNHSTLSANGSLTMSRHIYLSPGADEKIDVASGNTLTDNGVISALLVAGPMSIANGPAITAGPASAETLEISGPGTLVLNGDNTYTGGTTIDPGSTAVAGSDSAFGSGSITNAGTLATSNYMFDGPTPVVINASSLTLTPTSNLDLAIFGTPASGNYDYVSLGSGSATLAGKLNIRFINYVPSNGQAYTVVKTTGGVSGSFASVASNLSDVSFTQSELTGTGYQILIQSSGLPQLFSAAGLSGNQAQVADYFNNLSNQGQIPQSVINPITEMSFLSGPALAGYLQTLTPQDYAQLSQTAIDNMIFEQISVDGQVYDAFHGGGFDTSGLALLKTSQSDPFALNLDAAMQQADHQAMLGQSMQEFDAGGMTPPVTQNHLSSRWSGFLTGQIALDSAPQGGYPTQHFTTGSVMAGIDYRLTRHLLVGGLFNYSYTGGTLDNLGSREAANSYAPGLFAGYKLGGLQIDGLTQYTFNDYKIDRNIVLPGYQGVATGEPVSNQYDAALMADYYLHPCKGVDIGPSGGIGYTHMNIGGFTETGSSYALTTSKQSVDSFRTLLGFQGHWHLNKTVVRMPLVVSFNAFWQHEYIGRRGALVSTFSQIGSGSFLYNAPSPSRNSAILGIGIGGYLTKNTSLFVNYQTQIGDHRQFAQTVMAGLAVGF